MFNADGRTDMTMIRVTFHNFANAPKQWTVLAYFNAVVFAKLKVAIYYPEQDLACAELNSSSCLVVRGASKEQFRQSTCNSAKLGDHNHLFMYWRLNRKQETTAINLWSHNTWSVTLQLRRLKNGLHLSRPMLLTSLALQTVTIKLSGKTVNILLLLLRLQDESFTWRHHG